MTDLPKLLTAKDAAAKLGVSDKTFSKLEIRGILIGERVKYTEQDLIDFIERQRLCPSTSPRPRHSGCTTSG